MKPKITLSLILAICIMFFVSGCVEIDSLDDREEDLDTYVVEEVPVEGGEVFIPLTNFDTLNPLINYNASYYYFSKLIFQGIFEFDENLQVAPELAESFRISDEGRTISVTLKKDIKWHDGEAFTSSDVDFTINVLKYANNQSIYGELINKVGGIKETRIVDDYNIDIVFNREFGNNLEVLTFPIIPRHVFLQSGGNSLAKALQSDDYIPIGTGPFKYKTYEKFKTLTLERFDGYIDGKPNIELVIGRVLEDDELILTAFEAGQLSIATALEVDWDKYSQNDRIKAYEYISSNYEFLGFNFNNELFNSSQGLAIRKAINYGIDRQTIIKNNYLGHASQTDVPIHPDSWLISKDAYYYGYNVGKAKEELNKAGFINEDAEGILEDENGNRLSFRLITNNYNHLRMRTAQMIAKDLRNIGIEIIIDNDGDHKEVITEEMISTQWEELNDRIHRGDFDIALLGWNFSIVPDLSFMFHSSHINNSSNYIRYNSQIMDQLLDESLLVVDKDNKLQAYEKIQKHIISDLPYVSLFFKNQALLVDSKLSGELNPTFFNLYRGLENCYIRE